MFFDISMRTRLVEEIMEHVERTYGLESLASSMGTVDAALARTRVQMQARRVQAAARRRSLLNMRIKRVDAYETVLRELLQVSLIGMTRADN